MADEKCLFLATPMTKQQQQSNVLTATPVNALTRKKIVVNLEVCHLYSL